MEVDIGLVSNFRKVWNPFGCSLCVLAIHPKQNKFIQDELSKEMRSSFDTLTGIVIKLIDQQKKMQLEQKGLENSYKTLVEIIASLSGNGLKDKFLRMQERNENKKY